MGLNFGRIEINMNYIFLLKDNRNGKDLSEEAVLLLKKYFDVVDDEIFQFSYGGKIYDIGYYIYGIKENSNFKMEIWVENVDNLEKEAEILEKVHETLYNKRKEFHIVVTYDGVSKYYCDKVYSFFNKFERKIRELIYKILINKFDEKWYDETVTNQMDKSIKRRANCSSSKLIENALQEMSIGQLESYLFEVNINKKEEKLRKVLLDKERFSELITGKKDDVVKKLESYIPKSLWEEFFQDILDIEDMKNELEKIRNLRNKVSHCKEFFKDDFEESEKILIYVTEQLEKAIILANESEFEKEKRLDRLLKLESLIVKRKRACEQFIKIAEKNPDKIILLNNLYQIYRKDEAVFDKCVSELFNIESNELIQLKSFMINAKSKNKEDIVSAIADLLF